MRFSGTRRARGIILILVALLAVALWRASDLYARQSLRSLGPTLIAELESRLHRKVSVERLVLDRPGTLLAEGVRVSQGKTFDTGVLLEARRVEIKYNPALLAWDSVWTRGAGLDNRATLLVEGLNINRPNPLPVMIGPNRLLAAETLKADFSLAPLLTGKGNLPATIGRIELGKPAFAAVHRADGTWDLNQYLKNPDIGFRGDIVARDARIDLIDLDPGSLPRPQHQKVAGDFILQFAGTPLLRFSARGRTLGAQRATFEATGTRDSKTERWHAAINAETPSIPYWYRYFVKDSDGTEVLAGAAKVTGSVWDDNPRPHSKAEFRLDLDIRNGAARVPKLNTPFRDFNGRISSQKELLVLAGRATYGGIPLELSGEVLGRAQGQANWSLASRDVRLDQLSRVFPDLKLPGDLKVAGPLDFRAVLTGEHEVWSARGEVGSGRLRYRDLTAPEARFSFQARFGEAVTPELRGGFRLPEARQLDLRVTDLAGNFDWKDGLVHTTGRFRGFGGAGALRGWVRLAETQAEVYLTGRVENVRLRELPWKAEGLEISGVGGAEFTLSGAPEAPVISAFARATGLTVNGQPIDEVAARVGIEGEATHIHSATIHDRRGTAVVTGTILNRAELDLEVSAQGIELRTLLGPETDITGRAYLRGRLGGTLKEPTAAGDVKLYQPEYGGHAADFAAATFKADRNNVQLSSVNLIRSPETLTSELISLGRGGESGAWEVAGRLEVHGLTAGRAVLLATLTPEQRRAWPIAGDVRRLVLDVRGPLALPSVAFSGAVSHAAARGIDLGELSLSGRVLPEERRLELTSVDARSPAGVLSAKGAFDFPPGETWDLERWQTRLTFRAEDLDLRELIRQYQPRLREYADIRGLVAGGGTLTGSLAMPAMALEDIRVRNLRVNGEAVSVSPLRARVSGSTVIIREVEARVAEGRLTLPYLGVALGRDKRPARVSLGPLTAENMPVGVLLGFLEAGPALTDDQRGWLASFDRWAQRVGTLNATVALSNPAEGSATDSEIEGRLSGTAPEPEFSGQVRITGVKPVPGLGQELSLDASFTAREDRFTLASLKVEQPGGILLSASGQSEGGALRRLRYTAEATGLDLNLTDQLPDRQVRERLRQLQPLSGTLAVRGHVAGTEKQPTVTFSAEVRDPVVAGVPLDRAVATDVAFSAEQSRVSIGAALLTKRPSPGAPEASLRVSGFLPLTWPELSISADLPRDLTVELPQQPLTVLNALASDADRLARRLAYDLPAGRERFTHLFGQVLAPEGTIEGRIRLAGTANNPDNSGDLTLSSENVRIRGLPTSEKRGSWHLPGWLSEEIARTEPLQTSIRDFRLRVQLAGDTVMADLAGKSSHGGGFSGGGQVTLGRDVNGGPSARLNLRLDLAGFRINERDGGRVLGVGYQGTQLKTTLTSVAPIPGGGAQPIRVTGDWPAIMVSGGVRLDDASLPLAFDTPASEDRVPLPENVSLALTVLPGKEVWLRNPLVRLQLEPPVPVAGRAEGMLLISNRLTSPRIQGTLRASNGVFNLPLIRLRNAEGIIRVAYDGRSDGLEVANATPVYIDLTAETTLRIQRSPAVEAEYYDATFEIRGSPGSGSAAGIRTTGVETGLALGAEGGLSVTVRTDPPLPSGRIEALIRQQYVAEGFGTNGANVVEALRGQIEQAFAVNVASEFTGRVEDIVRSALGLSIFSVDFGLSQPLRVRLGKRLFGPVYATVSQSFGGAETQVERRYEVYYRVSPQLRVGYRQEDPLGRKVFFISGTASF